MSHAIRQHYIWDLHEAAREVGVETGVAVVLLGASEADAAPVIDLDAEHSPSVGTPGAV